MALVAIGVTDKHNAIVFRKGHPALGMPELVLRVNAITSYSCVLAEPSVASVLPHMSGRYVHVVETDLRGEGNLRSVILGKVAAASANVNNVILFGGERMLCEVISEIDVVYHLKIFTEFEGFGPKKTFLFPRFNEGEWEIKRMSPFTVTCNGSGNRIGCNEMVLQRISRA